MYKRILVAIDGSSTATKALVAALQLARDGRGRVRLVTVMEQLALADTHSVYGGYSGELLQALREAGERVLNDATAIAESAGVEVSTVLSEAFGERLGEVIADEAMRWNADLIVVGTHGRRGVGRVLMGSGAEQIIRLGPLPVLVVRSEPAAVAPA